MRRPRHTGPPYAGDTTARDETCPEATMASELSSPDGPSVCRHDVDRGRGASATVYLAIDLPGDAMPARLTEIQAALADAARAMTEAGHAVQYLNGMYMPARTSLLCVFAAESAAAVHATVELVGLPYVHIEGRDRHRPVVAARGAERPRDRGPASAG